ncbi:hypothetical protein QA597_10520 [Marinilabiliaceae bacterium ANBcel2]|nr:hypothetical protein [Marinilabiliaceae bacterium ANBcel2]
MRTTLFLTSALIFLSMSMHAQKDLFQASGELYGKTESITKIAFPTYCDTGYVHVDTLSLDTYMTYIYPNHQSSAGLDMFMPAEVPLKHVRYNKKGRVVQTALIDGDKMDWYKYRYDWYGRLKKQASGIAYRCDDEEEFEPFFSMQRKFKRTERRERAKDVVSKQTGYRVLYDQNINPVKREFFDENNRLIYRKVYSSDENNSQIKYPAIKTLRWSATYHDDGQPMVETGYDKNENITQTIHFSYDENNMPQTEVWKDSSGKETFRWNYLYDDNRKLLELEAIAQGEMIFKYIFEYNQQHHIVHLTLKTPGNKRTWRSDYGYDEVGNWEYHFLYIDNGPVFYSQREIEYY